MLTLIRSLWIWTATAALMLFWCGLLGAVWLFDRDPLRRRTARWFRRLGWALARVNPWRIHFSGLENLITDRPCVIVANHQSLADIPVFAHLRVDAKWLGKAELYRLPVIGWMMRMAGDVPVERGDRVKAARALMQCARVLRQGCSVFCFPEGTRSRDGNLLPFNAGPFQMAIREGVPVLPLVVEGSGAALPRNTWLFGPSQDVYVRVLEAVPTGGWETGRSGELRDAVRQRMADALARLRQRA
jgi:1-acyl-sn-glycerol-3-phosphate acyltransferase